MATLSATEILVDTLDAFRMEVPMLNAFSTDFSTATAVKDQIIMAHVSGLPAVQSYDATTGFKANAATADSLLTDVPVTLDQLKHVPIKVSYLTQLASKKNLYLEAIRNYAYVLGKSVVDYALTKVVAAQFSYTVTEAVANTTLDTLENVRTKLNANAAAPSGRFGLVNSAVSGALLTDQRISSALFYGQLNGNRGYRTLQNVAGFENVWEYPDLPSNAENLTGFFGDRRAVIVASRLPDINIELAQSMGIPQIAAFDIVSDPQTGLSLLGISWQEAGTFDVYVTVAILYGVTAGRQSGAAANATDKAGVRLITA